MTREEAINILNRDDDSMRKGYFCINDFKAIEVLKSQEPILDKIRDEIMQLGYEVEVVDYDHNDITRIKKAHWIIREEVLWIIDKYKKKARFENKE